MRFLYINLCCEGVFMGLGKRIKHLRIALEMTRAQLADELNIKYSTLSNYENDVRQPDYDTLMLIAKYFSVDPNSLLGFYPETEHETSNSAIKIFIAEAIKLPERELIFFIKFLKFVSYK